MTAESTAFGTTASGEPVEAITLRAGDLTAVVLTWGAVLPDVRLAGVPAGAGGGFSARPLSFS